MQLSQAVNSARKSAGRNLSQRELKDLAGRIARGEPDRYGMKSWMKDTILGKVLNNLGQVGQLIEALIRPSGKSLTDDIRQEIDAAGHLLREFGYDVKSPNQPGRISEVGPELIPSRRTSINPDRDSDQAANNQPLVEGPILVTSSNVYSIGYEHPLNSTGPGDLLVRFLDGPSQARSGPGALYRYKSVPYSIFKAFEVASSKGGFVWDELRVRGTVSGHQFDYELAGAGASGYIPRQAGTKRGQTGEFYLPRTLGNRRSSLPERQVKGARGNLPGWDRRNELKLRAGNR